jgi:hypothetical protein
MRVWLIRWDGVEAVVAGPYNEDEARTHGARAICTGCEDWKVRMAARSAEAVEVTSPAVILRDIED